MSDQTFVSVPHEVVRWSIPVEASFDDFRARYESAVPVLDDERIAQQVSWKGVEAVVEENAPYGFMRFWGADVGSLMRLAGDSEFCVTYLMGNQTIAERMYRHDPLALLYAPLRTTIHVDASAITRFSIDQPSTAFSSFNSVEIAQVGVELDRKVAELLRVLGVAIPDAFLKSEPLIN